MRNHLVTLVVLLSTVVTAAPQAARSCEVEVKEIGRASEYPMCGVGRFGPDGYLWQIFFDKLRKLDPNTGDVLPEEIGSELGYLFAADFIPRSDGTLLYANFFTGDVVLVSADLQSSSVVASVPLADMLVGDDTGRVWATEFSPTGKMWEIDVATGSKTEAAAIGGLNSSDYNPVDGCIYAPWSLGDGQVKKIDPSTGAISTAADGFEGAVCARILEGDLYVLDGPSGDIIKVDLGLGSREVIATLPAGTDSFTFDSNGHIFYGNYADGFVARLRDNGHTKYLTSPGLIIPSSISILPGSSPAHYKLLVSDFWSVAKMRPFGRRSFMNRMYWDTRMPSPLGLPETVLPAQSSSYDPGSGVMYLSSWFAGNTVQGFKVDIQETVALYVMPAPPMHAVAWNGDVAVSILGAPGSVVTSSGNMIATGFIVPLALATDSADNLYVADMGTGTIYKIGTASGPLSTPVAVATDILMPKGFAIDSVHNCMYIAEGGTASLVKVDLLTGSKEVIQGGLGINLHPLTGAPPLSIPGVAISPDYEYVFVGGDASRVVYRIKL